MRGGRSEKQRSKIEKGKSFFFLSWSPKDKRKKTSPRQPNSNKI